NGIAIASTIAESGNGLDRELVFHAAKVPALGTRTYHLNPSEKQMSNKIASSPYLLENQFLQVSINPKTGNINSIFDKPLNREMLQTGKEGNVIELHENLPSYWDAWNIGYTDNSWELNKADSIELIEKNDVRTVIRVKKSFLGFSKANRAPTEGFPSSFFVQDIILRHDSRSLDIRMDIDWWEDHTLLKISFPFAIDADEATYEIPHATIARSTKRETIWEKARYEVPVHRWADLSHTDSGVSLINNSKYGMDIHNNIMRLTLLTSPLWPDPMADRGRHKVEYSIYPHAGDWKKAATVRKAMEMNLPLIAHEISDSSGSLTPHSDSTTIAQKQIHEFRHGNFSVDAENVVITALKKSEGRETLVMRIVETKGKETEFTLGLPETFSTAYEVDLLEKRLESANIHDCKLAISIKPFEIKSFEFVIEKMQKKEIK
ncbi:MAG: glycosyl hydrolase-related protein, partial [Chlorobiales bacterium]|nr:glycosyl hydrolase-related protein [Chlorobiales bacterium]